MPITIKKIAEIVGVSRGTVDRALHGKYGVSSEVKEKVLKVAKEHNYSPNLSGKMLSSKGQGGIKIGVVIVTNKNPFFDKMIKGISDTFTTLKEFGIQSIVKIQEEYSTQEQLKLLDEFKALGVKGILITPINSKEIEEKIAELSELGIKIVTVNSDTISQNRLAFVGCDYRKSGKVMAEIIGMIRNDRSVKIALLTGTKKNLAVSTRSEGLISALEKSKNKVSIAFKYDNEDDDEMAYKYTKKIILESEVDYICLMGAGIKGALKALEEISAKVKKTPKLLSYDMTASTKSGMKKGHILAVITQDPYRQGSQGVQILFDSIVRNQAPQKELNYTELNIKTKSCI